VLRPQIQDTIIGRPDLGTHDTVPYLGMMYVSMYQAAAVQQ